MKKKVTLVAAIAAILVAVIAVSGTLAWFVDDDEATNVFTIGSVEIEQLEQQRVVDANGDYTTELEDFENDKMMIPVIENDTAISDVNFQDKIVTVKNIGKNAAFVQTFVAIPASLDNADILHINHTANNGWTADATPVATGVPEKQIAGEGDSTLAYNIYRFVYNTELAKDTTTTPAIDGVYIDERTDMDVTYDANGNVVSAYFEMNDTLVTDFDATGKINVYVASQAIQAEGFTVESGLATFDTHPWAA